MRMIGRNRNIIDNGVQLRHIKPQDTEVEVCHCPFQM